MEEENYLLVSDDGPGFYTLEGEGELIGRPSVFLRLFGCNLTCKGWATKDSPWGCDSFISWSMKNKYTFDEMFDFYEKNGLVDHLANGAVWKITGGEPMLRQEPILKFIKSFAAKYRFQPIVDVETNGTIVPDPQWIAWPLNATFTVSPKMANNGDPEEKRYKKDALAWHVKNDSCFKFVINTPEDLEELYAKYINEPDVRVSKSRIWLMVMAGSRVEHIERAEAVASLCKEHCFNFSPRLQLVLWDKALKV